jgi:hypothetical protein
MLSKMGVPRFERDRIGGKRSTVPPEILAGNRDDETAKLKTGKLKTESVFWSRLWTKVATSTLLRFG